MEAARVLALRGHNVTLYEKSNQLGGQLRYAFYSTRTRRNTKYHIVSGKTNFKAQSKYKMGKEADLQTLEKEHPDAVIVATGGRPIMLNLPGIKGENVYIASSVLEGKVTTGRTLSSLAVERLDARWHCMWPNRGQ